jgi:hypothetical protein
MGLLLLGATAFAKAADKPDAKPSTSATVATNATNVQVLACYCHGTIRCETCLKIEKQAGEAIKPRFKSELTAKRLVFKPVNYDLSENAHFLGDYKLPCRSLVLWFGFFGWKVAGLYLGTVLGVHDVRHRLVAPRSRHPAQSAQAAAYLYLFRPGGGRYSYRRLPFQSHHVMLNLNLCILKEP